MEGGQWWLLGDGATAGRFDRQPAIVAGFTRGVFGGSGDSMTGRANTPVESSVRSITAGRPRELGFFAVIKVRFALFFMTLSAKFGLVLMEHKQQTSFSSSYSSLSGGS